jgi:hypothetical protein
MKTIMRIKGTVRFTQTMLGDVGRIRDIAKGIAI